MTNATEAWNDYWSSNRAGSCLGAEVDDYHNDIASVWTTWGETLTDNIALLEVGCGNGAVTKIIAGIADNLGRDWLIHAVDLADIQPIPINTTQSLQFHPLTDASDTSFPDEGFDCIYGQFAIEYCPVEPLFKELSRVAKNGCTMQFICHSTDSVVCKTSDQQIHQIDFLLNELTLDQLFISLVGAGEQQHTPARSAFDQAASKAIHYMNSRQNTGIIQQYLQLIGQLFSTRSTRDPDLIIQDATAASNALVANKLRLVDLQQAIQRYSDLSMISEIASRYHISLSSQQTLRMKNGITIGKQLTAIKSRDIS